MVPVVLLVPYRSIWSTIDRWYCYSASIGSFILLHFINNTSCHNNLPVDARKERRWVEFISNINIHSNHLLWYFILLFICSNIQYISTLLYFAPGRILSNLSTPHDRLNHRIWWRKKSYSAFLLRQPAIVGVDSNSIIWVLQAPLAYQFLFSRAHLKY